jgi:redox-sensing transcriptional repressor
MDQPRPDLVPNPAVRRLSLYLRQLESFQRKDRRTVSSKQLGESLNLTDAQVRKDLAHFGQFGHSGIGYRVDDLIARVRHILGTDKIWNVLLVGAGNLGSALMAYHGFDGKGFRLVAVFDANAARIGERHGPFAPADTGGKRPFIIQPMSQLNSTAQKWNIRLAILAVQADHAQDVCEQVVAAGVRGILNFAPVSLSAPREVALNSVDLAVQLAQLSFQVNFSPLVQTA